MTRRALITGAAGFVGQVLSARLRTRGWEVLCSDAKIPVGEDGWHACDLRDRAQVDHLVEWAAQATHVFHLAAVTFVPEASEDPTTAFEVNLLGTVHLAQALRRRIPHVRLIHVSSAEIYGPPQFLPITETHPVNPLNPYAISKAAADQYCDYLYLAKELDVIRMRPFNHSGPGQSDLFVLSSFAHQIACIEAGKLPPVLHVGNLNAARDFSHVNDVVHAYERVAEEGLPGEAYNVCSGHAVSIRDALDRLCHAATREIRVEVDPERVRPVDVPEMRGSHEKLTEETGWRPEISFDTLLHDLLAFWRQREAA